MAGAVFTLGAVCVAVLSLLPQTVLPSVELSDKLQHLIAYLCLALAGGIAFPQRRSLIALGLGLIALGVGLEVAQGFVPGRLVSAADAIANTAGVALGLIVARIAGSWAGLSP